MQIRHFSRDELSDFARGITLPVQAAFIEHHLERCLPCQAAFDQVDLDDDLVVQLQGAWSEVPSLHADSAQQKHSESAVTDSSSPPKRIGDYEIVGVLGRGGMGLVYKATDLRLGRTVALKVISQTWQLTPKFFDRFQLEAEAVAKLQHANIVQIFETGQHEGQPFCAFEYVDGGSLSEKMRDPMRPDEVASLFSLIALGVQHAHDSRIIHRDLKPANVLMTKSGSPKIADFGLAKEMTDASKQTTTGTIVGTAYYMAPEQARGGPQGVTPLADVYSLGAMMYEALVGLPPFRGDTPIETLELARNYEPINPTRLRPEVGRDLETICLRCLEKRPEKRYQTAKEVADDLNRFLDGRPIHARPVGQAERLTKWSRRHPARAGLIAVSAIASAAILIGLLFFSHQLRIKNDDLEKRLDTAHRGLYTNQLRAADATHDIDPQHGLTLLADEEQCLPKFRDFTWHYLYHLCNRREEILVVPALAPRCLVVSPNERFVFVGEQNGRLRRWDLSDPARPVELAGHTSQVNSAAFDESGELLATASRDRTVRIWNAERGTVVRVLDGHNRDVNAVCFLASTRLLASAGTDCSVRVWNVDTGAEVAQLDDEELNANTASVFCLASSSDGDTIISGSKDGTLRVWKWRTDEPAAFLPAHHGAIRGLAISPDGGLLASCGGGGRGEVLLWQISADGTLEPLDARMAHEKTVKTVAFSPDQKWLVAACANGDLMFWDLLKREPLMVLRAHDTPVEGVAVVDRGERVISTGIDSVSTWKVTAPQPVKLNAHVEEISSISFVNDDQLVTASWDGSVRLWNLRQAANHVVWQGPEDRVSVDSDGQQIVWSSQGKLFVSSLSDAMTGDQRRISTAGTQFNALLLNSTRNHLTAAEGNEILIRDLKSGRAESHEALSLEGGFEILAVDKIPATNTLAFICGNAIEFLNLDNGNQRSVAVNEPRCLAIAPDGSSLSTGHADGSIRLWSLPDATVIATLKRHTNSISALTYSPDGRVLASGSKDESVRLWDPIVGHERAILRGQGNPVTTLSFSPNGSQLAAGDDRGIVLLWQTR